MYITTYCNVCLLTNCYTIRSILHAKHPMSHTSGIIFSVELPFVPNGELVAVGGCEDIQS